MDTTTTSNWPLDLRMVPGVVLLLALGFVFGRSLASVVQDTAGRDDVILLLVAMFAAFWTGTRWQRRPESLTTRADR